MTRGKIIALGLGAYALFVLSNAPAAQLYGWLKPVLDSRAPQLAQFQLYDITGSLWKGQAGVAMLKDIRVAPLHWDLHTLPLLMGSIVVDIDAKNDKNTVSGTFKRGLFGSLGGSDIRINVNLSQLPPSARLVDAGMAKVEINGQINAQFEDITMSDDLIVESATGELKWSNAQVSVTQPFVQGPFAIGSYVATASNQDDAVEIAVKDHGNGPIKAKGSVKLTPDSGYAISMNLAAQPNAPQEIAGAMSFMGPQEPDGSRKFTLNGRLRADPPPANANGAPGQPPAAPAPQP